MSGAGRERSWHGPLTVRDDERPDPEMIAARLELGSGEYHEHCCPWLMWANDPALFESMPSCQCGGEELAKGYVEFGRALRRIAEGDYPEELSASAWAEAVLREQVTP